MAEAGLHRTSRNPKSGSLHKLILQLSEFQLFELHDVMFIKMADNDHGHNDEDSVQPLFG